jgi:hypothetical protein
MSLVRHVCPHVLRGGTSADDSRRLIIMANFLVDCGLFYESGFIVIHISDAPVQLRR